MRRQEEPDKKEINRGDVILNILVACEESQRVTIELRKLGHNAYSSDLNPCSGGFPQYHIQSDVIPLIDGFCSFSTSDGVFHSLSSRWDLIIAHPPCTYLTAAGACRLFSSSGVDLSRYSLGLAARDFFMKIYNCDCDRICIENPAPLRIYNLPRYSQIIQPYQFGDNATKRTCLWLKGLPNLIPTNDIGRPGSRVYYRKDGSKHYKCWTQDLSSAAERSKTFPGIAVAMAYQFTTYKPLQLSLFD